MNLTETNPELCTKIIKLSDSELNNSDDHERQIKILLEAFSLIPEPATQWDHPTTHIANFLSIEHQELGDYDKAIYWGKVALDAKKGIPDTGVFLSLGIAYYHNNQLDEAFYYFDQAYTTRNKKNRAFLGYEPIYFNFYREHKGIPIKKK